MNLNEHIWSIFDIDRENDADIGVAKDMFIANLEQKKPAQREAYDEIIRTRYKDLTAARREDGRERFEAVAVEAVAALEAAEKK